MEDALVGISAFCVRPSSVRSKRVIGSYNTVDPKLLKELDPQIIFAVTGYQREFALRLGKDYPVYAIELPVSVPGIIDTIVKVGLVCNRIEEADRLARNLIAILSRQERLPRKLRVHLEIDLGGPVSFGTYSYITDALRLLGAESIHERERCEWLTPELDQVKRSNPDAIVYEAKMFKRFSTEDLNQLLNSRGWQDMDAVRNGNVFLTPGPLDFLAHHGPNFILETVPWLREKLDSVR